MIGGLVVAVLAALVMIAPTSRKLVMRKLVPILMRATVSLKEVLTSPSKLGLLFVWLPRRW